MDYNEHKPTPFLQTFWRAKDFTWRGPAWEYTQRATVQDLMSV